MCGFVIGRKKDHYKKELFTQDFEKAEYNKEKVDQDDIDLSIQKDYLLQQQTEEHKVSTVSSEASPSPSEISPAELAKKKKRRTIIIIIFAIALPVVLAIVSMGFLIWGLVVGFTTCINICGDCCQDCFGCCDACQNCGNCCNNCTTDCSNCCSGCDNCSCGSSSGTIKEDSVKGNPLKEAFDTLTLLIKWYYYRIIDFVDGLFIKK